MAALLGSHDRHRDHLDTVERARIVRDEQFNRSRRQESVAQLNSRPSPAPITVTTQRNAPAPLATAEGTDNRRDP
jgi:hypothetical protein